MFETTAFDVWREEQKMPKLTTLCSSLDKQLGGGLPCKINEFCGGPGTGKSQMCLQLCLTVQIPNGINGKAIFIDTNQDFSLERLQELAGYFSKHFKKLFPSESLNTYNVENLLENISYNYCANYKNLLGFIYALPNMLKNEPKIKLIIIDSFSYLIRQCDDVSERTSIIYKILTELHKISEEFHLVVVITNELTTHYTDNDNWIIGPALGNIHLHKINNRIILSRFENNRYAYVEKCFKLSLPDVDLPIQINANGLRSLPTSF